MTTFITVIHTIACFFLMIVVLLQAGKGGGVGIAFGNAGAQQVFGGRGAGNFLEKLTAVFAALFMFTSISLAYFASVTESSRLQQRSEQLSKEKDQRKKQEEELNKKAAEEAQKTLDARKAAGAESSSSTTAPAESSAPAPSAPGTAPAEGAGAPAAPPTPAPPTTPAPQ